MLINKLLLDNISQHKQYISSIETLEPQLYTVTQQLRDALLNQGKVLCCGNGGSAADSEHFSAEIAGRFKYRRKGFPALDLTSQNSLITSLVNDLDPDDMFSHQVEAFGQPGDVLVCFSTSGKSKNIIRACQQAKSQGLITVGFLGNNYVDGIDFPLVIPVPGQADTARIQEMHQLLYHTICQALDLIFFVNNLTLDFE